MVEWTDTPDFDFAHGENARSPSLYRECVVEAQTRPYEHGKSSRKLVALFEARNPNGLVPRLHQKFPIDVPEELSDAVSYLEHYGGADCTAEWPARDGLNNVLKTIDLVIGDNAPTRNPDWTRDEIILAL